MIKQYDKAKLKDGAEGYVVEVLEQNIAFIVDVERIDGTSTESLLIEDIEKVI